MTTAILFFLVLEKYKILEKYRKKLLERLDPAILDVMNTPKNIQELTVSKLYYDKCSIAISN